MSLDQRKDEDLAQIMTPDELRDYRIWEKREAAADHALWEARKVMRRMRARARRRIKTGPKMLPDYATAKS
jgi:hypothetical protein